MRSFFSALLAVLVLALACGGAQRGFRSTTVDPRTYTSPSGEYALSVAPSSPNGFGVATYRMSRGEVELWETTHPFTWTAALVSDEGTSAGYGDSLGVQTKYDEPGSLVVAVLDAKGELRSRDVVARTPSRFPDAAANPKALGLIAFTDHDRFVVRIADEDLNRMSEVWWTYRISTGERSATFRPKDGLVNGDAPRGVLGAVRVPGTPLALVHWHQYGEYTPARPTPIGSRFGLLDEAGSVVWSLDRPDDYAKVDEEQRSTRLGAVRARPHGGILRWDEPRRFDLEFVDGDVRVTFEVRNDESGKWIVDEIARTSMR